MLKGKIITAADQPEIDSLVFVIYGPPGTGKTSMSFTAEAPILFDFDKGAYRSGFRKDFLVIDAWQDVSDTDETDLQRYQTIVIDTVGRMLDMVSDHIIKSNPKLGTGGVLNQRGWGSLKMHFSSWVKKIRGIGKDIIFIAHSREEKTGDDLKIRTDIQGGSRELLNQVSDAIGHVQPSSGGSILDFSPNDVYIGKNPGGFVPLRVPDLKTHPDFFSDIIKKTKANLLNISEEHKAEVDRINKGREDIFMLKTPEDFNQKLEEIRSDPVLKKILWSFALDSKIEFNKESGRFEN